MFLGAIAPTLLSWAELAPQKMSVSVEPCQIAALVINNGRTEAWSIDSVAVHHDDHSTEATNRLTKDDMSPVIGRGGAMEMRS